ncbi:hypothetical protein HYPSUDRAFT_46140 [Hypholoma sublateritium FD-334 SS-4]|uniref:N-acetyltransferase domain-containing protein n=1 Tax=Hypholoma sublateritium (strain FD-334 SS-4) TaxID=945553 RepID=A0A0D2KSN4_HYPSF|nr:hypothetical protein HYPSUDRAFT_46140 [Hypholoma sublateritium FD-334 SS-4]
MLSEELRTLTASEPLSLQEEYEMQGKWQFDDDKLTFIILSRNLDENVPVSLPEALGELLPTDERLACLPMIGDVNIFVYGVPPSNSENKPQEIQEDAELEDEFYAEVEIMIAESAFRRKGLALEALKLMLGYATAQPEAFSAGSALPHPHSFSKSPLKIPPGSLVTKITDTNTASIRLFEKLGFEITKRVEVFHEVEMRFKQTI